MTDVDGRMVAWMSACYDRAEEKARAATPGPWKVAEAVDYPAIGRCNAIVADARDQHVIPPDVDYGPGVDLADCEHIAAHDPAWRLADIVRKRKILAIHRTEPDDDKRHWRMPVRACVGCGWDQYEEAAVEDINGCPVVRLLAEEFSGELGYDEGWRP